MKYRDMNVPATQRERADERQVQNNAGGFVYAVSDEQRLRRFLVLGTEGGTFYASQKDLTRENLRFIQDYAKREPGKFFDILLEVNQKNLAPRHSTVLMALAVLYTHGIVRLDDKHTVIAAAKPIEDAFGTFVRTGTHLFEFIDYVTMFRGWGRGLRRMVASWYLGQDPERLAYQIVKYRQRGGWTHRDVLRQAHGTKGADGTLRSVIDYAAHGPITIEDAIKAGKPTTVNVDVVDVIDQYEAVKNGDLDPKAATKLTWEMLPTEALRDPEVWLSLIANGNLPYTAMMRNLGRMTSIGVFDKPLAVEQVVSRLVDPEYVKKARVHPFNVLTALKTYSQGGGFRGSLQWTPKQRIVDALDSAFYSAFGNVPSTGKRINIALDVSGSMTSTLMNSNVTAREASVAMAMALIAGDPDTTETTAFTQNGWSQGGRSRLGGWASTIEEVGLSHRRRMDDVIRQIRGLRMGGTDCALPMLWAKAQNKSFDAFIVMTDSETWAGNVQPMDALRDYRRTVNPEARLIVVGMTSTGFTIADPDDAGSMDLVGFDSTAPSLIGNFIAGRF